ncbi:MAG: hypothetical protein M3443_09675 [Actinomycetota bacterium]|nr:hypothetical protein [Actinomycetota bacterium]
MSFEQLTEHASDIQFKATKHALDHREQEAVYGRNGVSGYYSDIHGLFKPFSGMPDPARYQPLIEDFRIALRGLSNGADNQDPINNRDIYPANPTLAEMTTASDYLEDWTGKAAMLFKQKFLDPFPPICRNQFILTSVLKSALEAHQAMWASARVDIDKIAHTTIDAFDNAGGCSKNSWNVTFTVFSSVAAIGAAALAAVPTLGASVPVAITAVGAAAQVAATSPPEGLGEMPASGETALQITDVMKAAIREVTAQVSKVEAKISQALASMTDLVSGSNGLFVAARPLLASVPPGGITGQEGLGTSD